MSFSASDNGSGVYSASLIIDGQTVESEIPNTNGGRCQPTRQNPDGSLVFNYVVPCPSSASGYFSYNTAQLANGAHNVRIVIADAAGNTTTAHDGTINVDNAGGSAPESTEGSSSSGSAASWSVSMRVTPHHVHQHTVITLSGVVTTSPRPSSGKLISLQARSVGGAWRGRGRKRHRVNVYGPWITFHVLNAKPDGGFSTTYRFRLGGDHRYQMRAVAPAEGGYAERTGSSPPVLVTET